MTCDGHPTPSSGGGPASTRQKYLGKSLVIRPIQFVPIVVLCCVVVGVMLFGTLLKRVLLGIITGFS